MLQHKCEFYGVTISTNVSSKNAFSVEQLDRNMHVKNVELWVVCTIITKMDGTQHINIGFLNIQRKAKREEKKSVFWL